MRMLDYGLFQLYKNMGVFGTAYDVEENENEIIFKMGVPGLDKEDIDILIRNGKRLIIKSEKNSKFTQPFYYAFVLPYPINEKETEAGIKNGILIIKLKKVEPDDYKVQM
jgi:HSP20 family molecular chaperone IbpA